MESYGNKRYSSGILCYNERACGGEEDFAGHVDRTLPLVVRDGRDSLCVRVLCTRNDVRLGNFKGNVDLVWPLVRRGCKYSDRACGGYYFYGILFVASFFGAPHDPPSLWSLSFLISSPTFFLLISPLF